MELTTRCPQCETVFSASLEQLQLRKGYIRCINCAHIFDGFEAVVPAAPAATSQKPDGIRSRAAAEPSGLSLVRTPRSGTPALGREPPSASNEPQAAPFILPPAGRSPVEAAGKDKNFSIGSARVSAAPPLMKEPTVGPARVTTPSPSAPYIPESAAVPLVHDVREPKLPSVVRERTARPAPEREAVILSTPASRIQDAEPETQGSDSFLYVEPRSQRRSSSQRPVPFGEQPARNRWMTPVWAVLALCGVVLLIAQMVYVYRAQLANTFPGLRPTLELACSQLSCSVPYERRLDAIAITGSALRASAAPEDGVSSLTLEVTLRNTYERPQEWPTLVLDLKDASGTIVVRRNLPPAAWVPVALREGPFMPGADLTVQVPLAVQGVQANGYQLDKFFP